MDEISPSRCVLACSAVGSFAQWHNERTWDMTYVEIYKFCLPAPTPATASIYFYSFCDKLKLDIAHTNKNSPNRLLWNVQQNQQK